MRVSFLLIILSIAGAFGKVCNVLDYGAKGDGITLDTAAIHSALWACKSDSEIDTLLFPSGGRFLSGPFVVHNNLLIRVESRAILLANTDMKSWPLKPNENQYIAFISGERISNITFTGGGIIDGQGAIWWKMFHLNQLNHTRPRLIQLEHAENVLVDSINLHNSPFYHISCACDNFIVRNVSIIAPADSPNTDGIDPGIGARNVHIHNCTIDNGDDCIAVKDNSEHVLVEDCIFRYGHGASVGAVTAGFVKNVTFRNIVLDSTRYGARIKTVAGSKGVVQDILYENIRMINCNHSILINMFYDYEMKEDQNLQDISISGITFRNITSIGGWHAGDFRCSSTMPCRGIRLENVDVRATHSELFQCSNAYGTADNVHPRSCLLPDH